MRCLRMIVSIVLLLCFMISHSVQSMNFLAPAGFQYDFDFLKAGLLARGMYHIDDMMRELLDDRSALSIELQILYGKDWELRQNRLITMIDRLKETRPSIKYVIAARSPGRITANEHTDYNGAVSLGIPTIQDDIVMLGIDPDRKDMSLINMEDKKYTDRSYTVKDLFDTPIPKVDSKSELDWKDYYRAVLIAFLPYLEKYGVRKERFYGMTFLVDGRPEFGGIPVESNISSSAGIEEMTIYGLEALFGLKGMLTTGEVIQAGRDAEQLINFPCGNLDQGSATVNRRKIEPGKYLGAAIDGVARTQNGKEKVIVEPFEVPPQLEALLVDTGPKERAQEEYNFRVIEGELGALILAKHLEEFLDGQLIDSDLWAVNFQDIDKKHNGRPWVYEYARKNRYMWPVFLKPAFFSEEFFKLIDVTVSFAKIQSLVAKILPDEVSRKDLIEQFGIPKKYFDLVTANAAKTYDVNARIYNLKGTVMHAIEEMHRVPSIKDALKRIGEAKDEPARIKALEDFGRLQTAGYESLKRNYRNSSRTIDAIVEYAKTKEWCLGARHFGAGWGGWMEIWIRPGTYAQAQKDTQAFMSETLSIDNPNMMPFKPGAPASVFGDYREEASEQKKGTDLIAAVAPINQKTFSGKRRIDHRRATRVSN